MEDDEKLTMEIDVSNHETSLREAYEKEESLHIPYAVRVHDRGESVFGSGNVFTHKLSRRDVEKIVENYLD